MAFACVCAPCILSNLDLGNSAYAAEEAWANATGESDLCRRDAMQHCIGAALMANACGSACSTCAGEILETLQPDWDPMDIANNEAGATCPGSTTQEAVACCEGKLLSGQLTLTGNCQ